jgi:hypothetical protein
MWINTMNDVTRTDDDNDRGAYWDDSDHDVNDQVKF